MDTKTKTQLRKLIIEIKTLEELLLSEMAFNRKYFVERIRDSFLRGGLKEYTKEHLALALGEKDEWSNEVRKLVQKKVREFMDSKKKKTTFKDRENALSEAMGEACDDYAQMKEGINEFLVYYPKYRKQIIRMKLDAEVLFVAMIEKYLPEYAKLL
jgi:hypothetical protein